MKLPSVQGGWTQADYEHVSDGPVNTWFETLEMYCWIVVLFVRSHWDAFVAIHWPKIGRKHGSLELCSLLGISR